MRLHLSELRNQNGPERIFPTHWRWCLAAALPLLSGCGEIEVPTPTVPRTAPAAQNPGSWNPPQGPLTEARKQAELAGFHARMLELEGRREAMEQQRRAQETQRLLAAQQRDRLEWEQAQAMLRDQRPPQDAGSPAQDVESQYVAPLPASPPAQAYAAESYPYAYSPAPETPGPVPDVSYADPSYAAEEPAARPTYRTDSGIEYYYPNRRPAASPRSPTYGGTDTRFGVRGPGPEGFSPDWSGYGGGVSSDAGSSSGRVSVRGYSRKDGTYVRPHTRSRPRRR